MGPGPRIPQKLALGKYWGQAPAFRKNMQALSFNVVFSDFYTNAGA